MSPRSTTWLSVACLMLTGCAQIFGIDSAETVCGDGTGEPCPGDDPAGSGGASSTTTSAVGPSTGPGPGAATTTATTTSAAATSSSTGTGPGSGTGGGGGAGGDEATGGGGTGGAAPECTTGDECESGACTASGLCAAPFVNVSGVINRYELQEETPRSDVFVTAFLEPNPTVKGPTGADGAYAFDGIPPGSAFDLGLFRQENTSTGALVFVPALLSTRVNMNLVGMDASEVELDARVVSFDWLARVAVDCGIFKTREEAELNEQGTGINTWWTTRNTIIGEIRDPDGVLVSGVEADQIDVRLNGRSNRHMVPAGDPDAPRVCFLTADGPNLEGSLATATTSVGRFVMFRVRGPGDDPFGLAEVRIAAGGPLRAPLPRKYVGLLGGNIGVVTLGDGTDFPDPTDLDPTFEADVYPLFTEASCVGCHHPGEIGYENSQERGGLKADYSGTLDEVYAVLLAGGQDGCANPKTRARVCPEAPAESLLTHNPLIELSGDQDHSIVFMTPDDPNYQILYQWIENGAQFN